MLPFTSLHIFFPEAVPAGMSLSYHSPTLRLLRFNSRVCPTPGYTVVVRAAISPDADNRTTRRKELCNKGGHYIISRKGSNACRCDAEVHHTTHNSKGAFIS